MKKIVLFVILIIGVLTATAGALSVKVNGEDVAFPDAQPFIDENNRVQVPVRFIAEKFGAKVDWFAGDKSITIRKGVFDITLIIGLYGYNKYNNTIKDGTVFKTDTAPKIVNDRTFIPLRFISEAFNAKVDWNDESKIATIAYTEEPVDKTGRIYFDLISEEGQKPNNFIAPVFYAEINKDYKNYPADYFTVYLENFKDYKDVAEEYKVKSKFLDYEGLNIFTDIVTHKSQRLDNFKTLNGYITKADNITLADKSTISWLGSAQVSANNIEMYEGIPFSLEISLKKSDYLQTYKKTISVPKMTY